jgi:hypothetical protein
MQALCPQNGHERGGGDVSAVARRTEPVVGEAWVVATLREHAPSMLSLARRHSLCADDAEDAYQRAVEIFLRRAGSVEPATVGGWLRTVVKHTYDRRRAADPHARGRTAGPPAPNRSFRRAKSDGCSWTSSSVPATEYACPLLVEGRESESS